MVNDLVSRLPRNRLIAELSVWSADLVRIADDIAKFERHADILHVDVADGHFAPALLMFPDLVAALRKASTLPIHIHLMCDDRILLAQIDQFAEAGVDLISVHAENANAAEALQHVRSKGLSSGIVLKWDTPVERARPFLPHIDFLTLLGTAIGVKGQSLGPQALSRLAEARRMTQGRPIVVAADGGIRENTVPELRKAGAETVVLGSLAFGAPDIPARMAWLKAL